MKSDSLIVILDSYSLRIDYVTKDFKLIAKVLRNIYYKYILIYVHIFYNNTCIYVLLENIYY